MLPVVRRRAQVGDGQALLRWADLDAAGATAFMRVEVMRPMPRFSSFYLRLPEASLPDQKKQIASNFIALTQPADLVRSATLLHRYATRSVLPIVMPFIDSKLDGWYCLVQLPVVAYPLKVAPEDAAPRVEQVLRAPFWSGMPLNRLKRILFLRAMRLNTFDCMVPPRPNRLSGMSCSNPLCVRTSRSAVRRKGWADIRPGTRVLFALAASC